MERRNPDYIEARVLNERILEVRKGVESKRRVSFETGNQRRE